VAAGRNREMLKKMEDVFGATGRFESVVLGGDGEEDSKALSEKVGGVGADAYLDFSPGTAAKSSHVVAALGALRGGGRAVFMGGIMGNIEIPYAMVMLKSLGIQGRFMYERRDVPRLIKMVESGMVKLGKEAGISNLGPYGLENVEEALSVAEANGSWGSQVVLMLGLIGHVFLLYRAIHTISITKTLKARELLLRH
jgi:threonine dehydrogenase-like Zn-dependent dehydrogenase